MDFFKRILFAAMRQDVDSFEEKEPVNIGKLIEEELRRQERSVTWFSRKLHCDRRNVYDIFTRQYIDTCLLYRISLILHKDFFSYFSVQLKGIDNQVNTPPRPNQGRMGCQSGMSQGMTPKIRVGEDGVNFISRNSDKMCLTPR